MPLIFGGIGDGMVPAEVRKANMEFHSRKG